MVKTVRDVLDHMASTRRECWACSPGPALCPAGALLTTQRVVHAAGATCEGHPARTCGGLHQRATILLCAA
jgi:hypothetical protein